MKTTKELESEILEDYRIKKPITAILCFGIIIASLLFLSVLCYGVALLILEVINLF